MLKMAFSLMQFPLALCYDWLLFDNGGNGKVWKKISIFVDNFWIKNTTLIVIVKFYLGFINVESLSNHQYIYIEILSQKEGLANKINYEELEGCCG